MTVQFSSDTVQMTVVKSKSDMSAKASAELRLKSGDVLDDAEHRIGWTAALATTSWLKLSTSAGVVHSSRPIAEVPVIAEGALTRSLVESFAPVTDFFALGPEIWGAEDPLAALQAILSPIL
jgi:hypothetical protein